MWVDRRGGGREDGMARELMSCEIIKAKKETNVVERPLLEVCQLQDFIPPCGAVASGEVIF